MNTFNEILKISFSSLSKELGVTEDFIVDTHDEKNSWSFITRLAQLIEAIVTIILVHRLNEPEIFGTISNLPQATRLALSYDLKVISKDQKSLLLTIAEIRNDYIHNISNVGISLKDYLSGLKNKRKTQIFNLFKPFLKVKTIDLDEFIQDCNDIFFTVCMLQIAEMHRSVEKLKAERRHKKSRAEQAEKLLPQILENSMYLDEMLVIRDFVKDAKEILKKNGLYEGHRMC